MSGDPIPISEFGRPRWGLNVALALSVVALLLIVGQWFNEERHFKKLDKQAEASQTQLTALEKRMEELQSRQGALEARYQEISQQSDSTTIADVEQTLLIANQQLQVTGNIRSALYALEVSDERLSRVGTDFAPLRKVFAQDMANLQRASTANVTDIGARLDSAVAEIDTLPLAIDVHRLPKNSSSGVMPSRESVWRQLAAAAWHEIQSLISIQDRNGTSAEAAVLVPQQIFFLRQNIKLRLLDARLAWLDRDDLEFKADLQAAQQTLTHYFALENPEVAQLRALLRALAARRSDVIVPDLTGSLAALRAYRVAHPQS